MIGNKQVYKEAYEQARSGKSRSLWQRLMFQFEDHYTQQSREQGEHDGAAARSTETVAMASSATASSV